MKVKICGIAQNEDVRTCEEHGADFIGFINIKRSKRFVDLDEISELTAAMKNKKKAVLVMEPQDLKDAEAAIKQLDIGTIQLHSLSDGDIKALKQNNTLRKSLKIIKAIGIPENIDASKKCEIETHARICDFLLFDSQIEGKSGGTGKQIPLKQAAEAVEIAKSVNKNIKLFLAGGINTARIKYEGKTVESLFDYVDVNSGVEDQPGFKNSAKIGEFMQTVKNLDRLSK
jgi:phosphoribosylanthranilate isomerase